MTNRRSNHLLGIFARACAGAIPVSSRSGGSTKMLTRIGQFLLDLRRALHVDVEQQVVTLLFASLQESPRGTVIISEHAGVFKKFVRLRSSSRIFAASTK